MPTTVKEVRARGWEELDVIIFTGDAYVDHPSFGAAVIGRVLEAEGYRVAIVPQPNWQDDLRDFTKLGPPKLFFGVTAGAMDSMVNHYTANKRLRSDDAYTPGGEAGRRPDRAVTIYTRILKKLYPHIPVVAAGIEASLRRLTHYDYWEDRLRPSILIDSGADIVAYGMGERVVLDIAKVLKGGFNAKLLRKIPQVAYLAGKAPEGALILNSYEDCVASPEKFAENFVNIETESNRLEQTKIIAEPVGEKFVVVNPPYPIATAGEADIIYGLPYTRLPHPRYDKRGTIPAFEMIKFSVNIHRGCFGGCSFCTISAHQGKFITSRSEKSILAEIDRVAQMPGFRGNLSDLGGPSANMYAMGGRNIELCRRCIRPSCAFPALCKNLDNSHERLLKLYRTVRKHPKIKKAFVGSGIRYDLFDRSDYLKEVVIHHTSGRLKVAPEHTESHVLALMRKPPFAQFERLEENFRAICQNEELRYQIIPYFISSHPGCTEADMRRLSQKARHLHTDQVQDLTPTPMTLSSVMFYTGRDPYTGDKLYVARSQDDKRRQKAYFFRKG